ncbi:MAG: (Fe-S)-binding protein [Fidelibacterota bacterium]
MNEMHHTPGIFYIFALIAVSYTIYNFRRLFVISIGKSETKLPKSIFNQLSQLIRFALLQRKVFSNRFTYAGIMHFFLGWGFFELLFATTVDFLTARGIFVEFLPHLDTPWFAFINDLGGFMLIVGLIMAISRRSFQKPELLPHKSFSGRGNFLGDTGILLFLLLLAIGGFLSEAARLGVEQPDTSSYSWIGYPLSLMFSTEFWILAKPILWWFHAITSLLFIAVFPLTKMFHAFVVFINVLFTNQGKRGHQRPMHVSDLLSDPDADIENITLGVETVKDLTWKQLLDSASCTECARCTTLCPAAQTGKPLSPMKIITDIRNSLTEIKNGNHAEKLVGSTISETEIWSCTTCGACMDICPVLIDHVPTFIDLRRYQVLSEGNPPDMAGDSLEKTTQSGNPWGFPKSKRMKWAEDAGLEVPVFSKKKSAEVLYWIGCAGAYDPRNQEVTKAMVNILQTAGVDFAVLGLEESCTGDSARRLGEEYIFETMALQNIETFKKYSFDKIVTQCPHCFHTLNTDYKDFGADLKVEHHSQFLNELIDNQKITIDPKMMNSVTYHDPCYLGRYNNIYDSPRSIIHKSKGEGSIIEMPRNRQNSFCCGAGGGNMWHEINDGERMNINRFDEAIKTGADSVVTSCSFCLIMMDDAMRVQGKEKDIEIFDIAEIVNSCISPQN